MLEGNETTNKAQMSMSVQDTLPLTAAITRIEVYQQCQFKCLQAQHLTKKKDQPTSLGRFIAFRPLHDFARAQETHIG